MVVLLDFIEKDPGRFDILAGVFSYNVVGVVFSILRLEKFNFQNL
jgi:hypothetical protein